MSALSISGSSCGFMQHQQRNWEERPSAIEVAHFFTMEGVGLACSS